jgi:hypothetical protein
VFKAIKPEVDAHRDWLSQQTLSEHGLHVRFRFSIPAWQCIPLNLPDRVPASHTIITGDVKKAFEAIPLTGPDGLDLAITAYIKEGFDHTGHDLFIPVDDQGLVCGKARFARGSPPPFGKISHWLRMDLATSTRLAVHYSQITVIRTGQFLVRQTVGVPMGGPPCAQYCDIYLDHYEYRLMTMVLEGLQSLHRPTYQHATTIAKLMTHFYRYADDTFVIAPSTFVDALMIPRVSRDSTALDWLYPLCDVNGHPVLQFESDPVSVAADGTISGTFLCLTVQLSVPAMSIHATVHRTVNYSPYNTRHKFGFQYPALARWDSFTPSTVLTAALSTMAPYAIIGSTQPDAAFLFLATVCRRLHDNSYPKAVVLSMWEDTYHNTVVKLPCRLSLQQHLPTLYNMVRDYITALY